LFAVRVSPSRAVPEIVGGAVFTGGACVAADPTPTSDTATAAAAASTTTTLSSDFFLRITPSFRRESNKTPRHCFVGELANKLSEGPPLLHLANNECKWLRKLNELLPASLRSTISSRAAHLTARWGARAARAGRRLRGEHDHDLQQGVPLSGELVLALPKTSTAVR
jgi:hypothetical protein